MDMKNWLIVVGLICLLNSCKDGDNRDDSILDMEYLIGKDWYYNGYAGRKEDMKSDDLLEVLRFERNNVLTTMDFGGRQENKTGSWERTGNRLTLKFFSEDPIVWDVLHSGEDYIETMVNESGIRNYVTELGYLGNLTADAFLVNVYDKYDGHPKTYIGARLQGNMDIREGKLLLGEGENISFINDVDYWSARTSYEMDNLLPEKEVRFYLRIGKDYHVKLRDVLYDDNLPYRELEDINLKAISNLSNLEVDWKPYTDKNVYYRLEILPAEGSGRPYFVSRVQPAGSEHLTIKATTAGEVNRLGELKIGESYMLRLSALIYEDSVDPWNDYYSYANIQAVSYFSKYFVWE